MSYFPGRAQYLLQNNDIMPQSTEGSPYAGNQNKRSWPSIIGRENEKWLLAGDTTSDFLQPEPPLTIN